MSTIADNLTERIAQAVKNRREQLGLTLRALARKHPKKLRELMTHEVPVHAVNANTVGKLMDFLREQFDLERGGLDGDQQAALRETEDAIACAASASASTLGGSNKSSPIFSSTPIAMAGQLS